MSSATATARRTTGSSASSTRRARSGASSSCWRSTFLFGPDARAADLGRPDVRGFPSGLPASSTASAISGATATSTAPMPAPMCSVGHPDRRRGTAQQPPFLRHLGQAVGQVVRVRHRLDVHPHPRNARPRQGEEACAQGELAREHRKLRPRDAAGRDHPSLRRLARDAAELPEPERRRYVAALEKSQRLSLLVEMRRELAALWQRSTATHEELLARLQDWCRRAEAERHPPSLQEFSLRLRRYAV
jgi:hypothetical protein